MTAARILSISDLESSTIYCVGSSSAPSHTMGPVRAGESLSGTEQVEKTLCRLSEEVLGLSEHTDMVVVGALIALVLVRSGEFLSRTEADERKSRVDAVGYE